MLGANFFSVEASGSSLGAEPNLAAPVYPSGGLLGSVFLCLIYTLNPRNPL